MSEQHHLVNTCGLHLAEGSAQYVLPFDPRNGPVKAGGGTVPTLQASQAESQVWNAEPTTVFTRAWPPPADHAGLWGLRVRTQVAPASRSRPDDPKPSPGGDADAGTSAGGSTSVCSGASCVREAVANTSYTLKGFRLLLLQHAVRNAFYIMAKHKYTLVCM